MGQIVRLGGHSRSPERPQAASPETPRRSLLIGALVAAITLAIGVVLYVGWPRTPSNLAAGPATSEVSDDRAAFNSQMTEGQLRARQAEQEKEDSAVFGQAPSAPAYQTPNR